MHSNVQSPPNRFLVNLLLEHHTAILRVDLWIVGVFMYSVDGTTASTVYVMVARPGQHYKVRSNVKHVADSGRRDNCIRFVALHALQFMLLIIIT